RAMSRPANTPKPRAVPRHSYGWLPIALFQSRSEQACLARLRRSRQVTSSKSRASRDKTRISPTTRLRARWLCARAMASKTVSIGYRRNGGAAAELEPLNHGIADQDGRVLLGDLIGVDDQVIEQGI